MKRTILGTLMVLAMAAGVYATGGEQEVKGKKANAACCNMDECCEAGSEILGCCGEGGCCG